MRGEEGRKACDITAVRAQRERECKGKACIGTTGTKREVFERGRQTINK